MNITKKSYTVSVKGSKNFQSVSLTEGFDVDIDDSFNAFDFEQEKQKLKDRLVDEIKSYLNVFVKEREIDDEIDIGF